MRRNFWHSVEKCRTDDRLWIDWWKSPRRMVERFSRRGARWQFCTCFLFFCQLRCWIMKSACARPVLKIIFNFTHRYRLASMAKWLSVRVERFWSGKKTRTRKIDFLIPFLCYTRILINFLLAGTALKFFPGCERVLATPIPPSMPTYLWVTYFFFYIVTIDNNESIIYVSKCSYDAIARMYSYRANYYLLRIWSRFVGRYINNFLFVLTIGNWLERLRPFPFSKFPISNRLFSRYRWQLVRLRTVQTSR